jgi:hypothetical protein
VGRALTLTAGLLIVWVFTVVDRHSHSASDTLIGTFPWGVDLGDHASVGGFQDKRAK